MVPAVEADSLEEARVRARCSLTGCLLTLGACADAAAPDAVGQPVRLGEAGMEAGSSLPPPSCAQGATEPCVCSDGSSGVRVCIGSGFGACNGCATTAPTATAKAKCVPGHYEGSMEMMYTPGPAGICGLATLFGGTGTGKFTFDLLTTGSDEFLSVGNGCVHATSESVDAGLVQLGAELFAKGVPMHAVLMGAVDCATGRLEGELRGTYRSTSVCGLGLVEDNFFFKGPFTGTFDPESGGFKDGTLTLREPPVAVALAGEPGGSGTWRATLQASDGGVASGDAGDCLGGVVFKDFELPDAGMPEAGTR
jgi:hypothetical protein